MNITYKVVCGFSGGVYSRHKSFDMAEKSAKKIKRSLKNCGSLASFVSIVDIEAKFTNIIPSNNEFGCVSIQQKRWVNWN